MKTVPFTGSIEEVAGVKLDSAISFTGSANQFENVAEMKEAGEYPNDADILSWRNKVKVASAKSAAYQKQIAMLTDEKADGFRKDIADQLELNKGIAFILATTKNKSMTREQAKKLYESLQAAS